MAFVFVDNQIPEIEEELIALGFVPEAYPGVLEDVGGQAYFATKPLGSPVTNTKPDTGTVSSKGWAFYKIKSLQFYRKGSRWLLWCILPEKFTCVQNRTRLIKGGNYLFLLRQAKRED